MGSAGSVLGTAAEVIVHLFNKVGLFVNKLRQFLEVCIDGILASGRRAGASLSKVVFEDAAAELAEVMKLFQMLLELTTGQSGFMERS